MPETPPTDLAHARWAPRLSEYLDGDLTPAERDACAAHLAACAPCAATLADLERVVTALGALSTAAPTAATTADDGWTALAAALPSRRTAWRPRTPWLAAAAAIALVTVGVVIGRREAPALARTEPTAPTTVVPIPATGAAGADASPSLAASRAARPSYDASVRELEVLLRAERDRLSPETVAVLERSLRTIDAAIGEAQRAVASDPANPYLESHLARTRARKLALLRQAVQLGQS